MCVCVSSTLPPSSIGQPECSLRTYSPVHEFSFLLRLTCCQACLQILHFCHYAFHLQHILWLFSQDVSSLVKFFLFVCVNVTRSVDITLQSSCGNFKIEGISGSASKSYLLVACSLISRPCVSFKGLCFLLDEKINYENPIPEDDITFLEFRLIYSFTSLLSWQEGAISSSSLSPSSQSCHWVLLKATVSYQHLFCLMGLKSSFFFPQECETTKVKTWSLSTWFLYLTPAIHDFGHQPVPVG